MYNEWNLFIQQEDVKRCCGTEKERRRGRERERDLDEVDSESISYNKDFVVLCASCHATQQQANSNIHKVNEQTHNKQQK